MKKSGIALALVAAALGGYALADREDREPGAWRAVHVPAYQIGKRSAQNDFHEVPTVTGAMNQLHSNGYVVVDVEERYDGSLLIIARR